MYYSLCITIPFVIPIGKLLFILIIFKVKIKGSIVIYYKYIFYLIYLNGIFFKRKRKMHWKIANSLIKVKQVSYISIVKVINRCA